MKIEIVEQRVLTADEGMTLTNGDTYGKTVVLPITSNTADWREITDSEAEQLQEDAMDTKE